jgi:hypothetical protein
MRVVVRILMIALLSTDLGACHPRVIAVSHAMPIDVQLKLSRVSRVWVAGFHVTDNREVDVNLETVKLVRDELRRATSLEIVDADPLVIPTEDVFTDRTYWRRLAIEHRSPLIVTGTVNFLVAPAKIIQRGRNTYVSAAGRVLEPEVVIIDGHTGEMILRERLPRRAQYGIGRSAFTLTLYFELMNRAMSDWVRAIAAGADMSPKL